MNPPRADRERWRPASAVAGHPLAAIEGSAVGDGFTLEVEIGPTNSVGAAYFRAFLRDPDRGRTVDPVVEGLQNCGIYPAFNWVEVSACNTRLRLQTGESADLSAVVDGGLLARLAELVPSGGHLMVEYDSPGRALTARALTAGVPPAATPLGAMLFDVGCGAAFKDWYIAEGGREGPRKLQGFRALDAEHERRRGLEMLDVLEAFLGRSGDLDAAIETATRPLAAGVVAALRERQSRPN